MTHILELSCCHPNQLEMVSSTTQYLKYLSAYTSDVRGFMKVLTLLAGESGGLGCGGGGGGSTGGSTPLCSGPLFYSSHNLAVGCRPMHDNSHLSHLAGCILIG